MRQPYIEGTTALSDMVIKSQRAQFSRNGIFCKLVEPIFADQRFQLPINFSLSIFSFCCLRLKNTPNYCPLKLLYPYHKILFILFRDPLEILALQGNRDLQECRYCFTASNSQRLLFKMYYVHALLVGTTWLSWGSWP